MLVGYRLKMHASNICPKCHFPRILERCACGWHHHFRFQALPSVSQLSALGYSSAAELAAFASTCKGHKDLVENESLWQPLLNKDCFNMAPVKGTTKSHYGKLFQSKKASRLPGFGTGSKLAETKHEEDDNFPISMSVIYTHADLIYLLWYFSNTQQAQDGDLEHKLLEAIRFNKLRIARFTITKSVISDIRRILGPLRLVHTCLSLCNTINLFNWADLSGADFSGLDLAGFDFSGAHLNFANFTNAFLGRTDLRAADLSDATFEGANLMLTDLRKAKLERANFWRAHVSGADFDGANIEEVFYLVIPRAESKMKNARPLPAPLNGQAFGNMHHFLPYLGDTTSSSAALRVVSRRFMQSCDAALFSPIQKTESFLAYIDQHKSNLPYLQLAINKGLLSKINFPITAEIIHRVKSLFPTPWGHEALISLLMKSFSTAGLLRNANLSGALLQGIDLSGVDFNGVYMLQADLSDAVLFKADFSGSDLTEANLSRAKLRGADFKGTILQGAKLDFLDLRSVKNLTESDVEKISLFRSAVTKEQFKHITKSLRFSINVDSFYGEARPPLMPVGKCFACSSVTSSGMACWECKRYVCSRCSVLFILNNKDPVWFERAPYVLKSVCHHCAEDSVIDKDDSGDGGESKDG
jgi:uncharacterized protein YjbI with pentapeptide repeats